MVSTLLSSNFIRICAPQYFIPLVLNSRISTKSRSSYGKYANLILRNSSYGCSRSSTNGYPSNPSVEDLDLEAKESARSWVRSGTAVAEMLQMFRIPTLLAIAIIARFAIAMGRTASLVVRCTLSILSMCWYLQFLWSALPPEKEKLFSAPQDFLLAVRKPFQEFFYEFSKIRDSIKRIGCQISISMLEECQVVGCKLSKIVRGDVGEVRKLKKEHEWIDLIAFLFACSVLKYITLGIKKAN